MPVHIHTLRSYVAGALGVILAVSLLRGAYTPTSEFELVPVSGRVTCGTHPLGGMWVVFEEDTPRGLTACGRIKEDGSFRMQPWGEFDRDGMPAGTYRVHFIGHPSSTPEWSVNSKYQDAATSGLLVHVGPDWEDIVFTLPDTGRGPTLAQHP